jgi:uncharacterized integral membrane protein (TIGR00698 family)
MYKTIKNLIPGLLVALFLAIFSMIIATHPTLQAMAISPLIISILFGLLIANLFRELPHQLQPGLRLSTSKILRFAIILYGFRLTFQDILHIGFSGIIDGMSIVLSTLFLGYIIGTKVLKLDAHLAWLISSGSAICGAAAVLATESTLKSEAYKATIAVSTVVLFGTISMFLYPLAYKLGFIPLDEWGMGLYIGSTLHEVAHVVGAGNSLTTTVANNAVIVKMIRVMMLAPVLLGISIFMIKTQKSTQKHKLMVPWFAVWFILVAIFHSFHLLPSSIVNHINSLDTFLLTMAMGALGLNTNIKKFTQVGMKPFYLAFILFLWLVFGGFYITKLCMNFI